VTDQPMDLFVIDGFAQNQAIALARRGPDITLSRLDTSHPEIQSFIEFTDRVEQVALGGARPSPQEMDDIGNRLFDHIFQGDIRRLYDRLPTRWRPSAGPTHEPRAWQAGGSPCMDLHHALGRDLSANSH